MIDYWGHDWLLEPDYITFLRLNPGSVSARLQPLGNLNHEVIVAIIAQFPLNQNKKVSLFRWEHTTKLVLHVKGEGHHNALPIESSWSLFMRNHSYPPPAYYNKLPASNK